MVTGRHVLFIVENNSVPFDRRVWAEARAVREFGYDVSIICPFDRNRRDDRKVIDGIRIYRHPRPIEGLKRWATVLEYLTAIVWESLLSIRIFRRPPVFGHSQRESPGPCFSDRAGVQDLRREIHIRPSRPDAGDLPRQVRDQEHLSQDPPVDGTMDLPDRGPGHLDQREL